VVPQLFICNVIYRVPAAAKKITFEGEINENQKINFFGWILFTVSAIGFFIASVGSFWSMFGSCFFLAGCLVFYSIFQERRKRIEERFLEY